MTSTQPDPGLIGEIAAAEEALRDALVELAGRLNDGKRGLATDELVQHCREMAEVLSAAMDQLGQGVDAPYQLMSPADAIARAFKFCFDKASKPVP